MLISKLFQYKEYYLRHVRNILISLMFVSCSYNTPGLIEHSGENARIRHGEYIIDANIWNIQAITGKWEQTIFYDTIKGNMGWRWDYSGEEDKAGSFNVKTFPEIIFGKKPYDGYESTSSSLPVKLTSAHFNLEYIYSANASGVYNTTTDLSFTDSSNPGPSNIRAKMMIWFDHQNFPFFENENLKNAEIDKIQYKIYIDTTYTGPEGKWNFIALLPDNFPSKGIVNFNEYFDYLLSVGALKPDWFLSSIEIGSEISSGKGEVRFDHFIVNY